MPHEKLKCGWLNALTRHTTRVHASPPAPSPPPSSCSCSGTWLAALVHLHLAAACAVCIDFSQLKSLTTHRMSHVQQRGVAGRFRKGGGGGGQRQGGVVGLPQSTTTKSNHRKRCRQSCQLQRAGQPSKGRRRKEECRERQGRGQCLG